MAETGFQLGLKFLCNLLMFFLGTVKNFTLKFGFGHIVIRHFAVLFTILHPIPQIPPPALSNSKNGGFGLSKWRLHVGCAILYLIVAILYGTLGLHIAFIGELLSLIQQPPKSWWLNSSAVFSHQVTDRPVWIILDIGFSLDLALVFSHLGSFLLVREPQSQLKIVYDQKLHRIRLGPLGIIIMHLICE